MPSKLIFLPGASGNTEFWTPVSGLLNYRSERLRHGWPGFGQTPPDPGIRGMDDLVARVVADIDRPSALIAQSMGGIIAIRAALQKPGLVTHLILSATSGGIDLGDLGAEDWREWFRTANPSFPRWFADYKEDLSEQIKRIDIPVLLLWGDADPISPVAVGERLATLLPHAEFHVIPGGEHDLANTLAHITAPLIDEFLSQQNAEPAIKA